MQQGVELGGSHPHHSFFLCEETLDDHVDCDLDGCNRASFGIAGLQHEQLATFDRELHVLHVTIVLLEQKRYFDETLVRFGYLGLHLVGILGRTNAGDDVLTLSIYQILSREVLDPGGIVTVKQTPVAESLPMLPKTMD